jgi:predicted transcriptional regulator
MATHPIPPSISEYKERLGELAMKFRGTRDSAERQAIARQYSQTVDLLIRSCS